MGTLKPKKGFCFNLPSHTYRVCEKCMAKSTEGESTPTVQEKNIA
jgi:hypothetical protein